MSAVSAPWIVLDDNVNELGGPDCMLCVSPVQFPQVPVARSESFEWYEGLRCLVAEDHLYFTFTDVGFFAIRWLIALKIRAGVIHLECYSPGLLLKVRARSSNV